MTEFSPVPMRPAGMTDQLPGMPRFYRHSGRVPANALAAGLLAAVLGGFGLGAAWGFLELYLHLAPDKITLVGMVFGVVALGMALGWIPAAVLARFKGRSPAATVACVLVCVATAYYAAWAFFILALAVEQAEPAGLTDVLDPMLITQTARAFYDEGLWKVFDGDVTPKGIVLALFWVAEFCVVLGVALKTAIKKLNKRTFCEHCETWGTARQIMEISDENWGELKKPLMAGNVDSLATATGRKYAMPSWCDVSIEGCPTCDNVQTLTVTRIVVTQNKKGKTSTKKTDLVRRLVMTPEQTVQVAVIAAGLKGPVSEGVRETI